MLYKKDLINLLDTSGCDYFIKEHEALYTVEDCYYYDNLF